MAKPLFQIEATKTFIQAIVEGQGKHLGISYEAVDEPIATEQGITLPIPSIVNENEWHGKVHREVSYLLDDNRFLFQAQRRYQEGTPHHMVASILADHIAERRDYGEYAGRSKHLTSNRARLLNNMREVFDSDQPYQDETAERLRSLMAYDVETRKDWMRTPTASLDTVRDYNNNCQYLSAFEELFGLDGVPLVDNATDFCNLVEQVLTVPPQYAEGDDDGEQTDSGDNNDGEGNQDGQGNQGQEGEGDGQEGGQDGSEGESQGNADESQEGEGNQGQSDGSLDNTPRDAGGQSETSHEEGPGSGANNIGSEGRGFLKEPSLQEIQEAVKANYKDCLQKAPTYDKTYSSYSRDISGYVPCPHQRETTAQMLDDSAPDSQVHYVQELLNNASRYPISKRLRKYLQVLRSTSYTYGLKKGKLNNSRLYRAAGGERQPRVYKQKNSSRLELDTAVQVLTDCSGSMCGSKEEVANIINVCIFDVLKSIQVPMELVGFSDSGSTLQHMVFKDFNESIKRDQLAARLNSGARRGGCNSDGDSLMWAAERLMKREESNKVLIVLSDGQPAGSYIGNGSTYLKHVCHEMHHKTPINLWGIGILTTAPRDFYINYKLCSKLDQLESIVVGVLKDSIIKKGN